MEDKNWFLRKSTWIPEKGILKGSSLPEGNGAFLRIKGTGQGGILPENYIMNFRFKTGDKEDGSVSQGNRISLGHYNFKVNWKGESGMILNILHGTALTDSKFKIKNGVWYEVIIESRGDEILFSFKNGPSYFMQHEVFKSKPAGWEYFLKKGEHGWLDDMKIWSLSDKTDPDWDNTKKKLKEEGRVFLQSENPDFSTAKPPKTPKKKK